MWIMPDIFNFFQISWNISKILLVAFMSYFIACIKDMYGGILIEHLCVFQLRSFKWLAGEYFQNL